MAVAEAPIPQEVAPRDTAHLPPIVRQRLTEDYRRLRERSGGLACTVGGVLLWGVHRDAVRAYVLARHLSGQPAQAVKHALFGTSEISDRSWAYINAIVTRLGALEAGR